MVQKEQTAYPSSELQSRRTPIARNTCYKLPDPAHTVQGNRVPLLQCINGPFQSTPIPWTVTTRVTIVIAVVVVLEYSRREGVSDANGEVYP
jgi:hypothetical protein